MRSPPTLSPPQNLERAPWGVQYRGGYHEYCGVILSTVGDVQYCGGTS